MRPLVVAAVPRFVTKLRMLPRSHSIYNVLGILTYADSDGRQPNDSSVSPAGRNQVFVSACQFLPDINCVVAAKEEFPAASAEEKRRST